ncbi:MAG: hypothetical protein ACR2O3_03375 [Rhizobiaceae bacterium]
MKTMPSPMKGFVWVFAMTVIFGILVGTLNIHNPEAVHIPFGTDENGNKLSAEGLDGLIASTLSSAVLGIIFGGLVALITWFVNSGISRIRK